MFLFLLGEMEMPRDEMKYLLHVFSPDVLASIVSFYLLAPHSI